MAIDSIPEERIELTNAQRIDRLEELAVQAIRELTRELALIRQLLDDRT